MTFVATAITAGTTIATSVAGAAVKNSLANKQKKRAALLRDEQSQLKANAIDQTYLDNKKIAQNKFITGLPSTGLMKNQLTNTTADALNKSRLATTNSGDLLSAIGNINKQEQEANLTLGIIDAEYRDNALTGISLNNQAIANEKSRLETIAETKRGALRKQAGALEDASTANKANATDGIISGIGSGLGTLAAGIGEKNNPTNGDKTSVTAPPPSKIPITTPSDKTPYVPAQNENIYGEITDEERALMELGASSKKRDGLVLPTPEEMILKNGGKIPSVFELSRLKNKAKKK